MKDAATKPGDKKATIKAVEKAPVPMHSHIVVATILGSSLYFFPKSDSLDELATVETFTNVLFPQYMSIHVVIAFRLIFSYIILYDCIYTILFGNWDQETDYAPESKLITVTIPIRGIYLQHDRSILRGLLTMSSFTMLAWLLLGIAFFCSAIIPIFFLIGLDVSPLFLRTSLLLFECAAPTTLLVTIVVRYAIWPMALESGSANTTLLKNPITLMEHNANLLMALSEVALLGGIPVRFQDFAIAPLFGILYVYFTWFMMDKWAPKEKGPQFCYFFFDTTLGLSTSVFLLALLAVLTLFYATFATVEYCIDNYFDGILSHLAFVLGILSISCRLTD